MSRNINCPTDRTSEDQFPYFFLEPLERRVLLSADVSSLAAPNIVLSSLASITQNVDTGTNISATAGQSVTAKIGTIYIPGATGGQITIEGSTIFRALSSSDPTCGVNGIEVLWGDGGSGDPGQVTLVAIGNGGYDVYGTHTYATPGVYKISINEYGSAGYNPGYVGPPVQIVLPMGMTFQNDASSMATVTAPTGQAPLSSGLNFNGTLATIAFDPGTGLAAGFTIPSGNFGTGGFNNVNIEWGEWDNALTTGATLVANGNGQLEVTGKHTFSGPGIYTVTISGSAIFTTPSLDFNGGGSTGKLNFTVTIVVTNDGKTVQSPPSPTPIINSPVTPISPSPVAPAPFAPPASAPAAAAPATSSTSPKIAAVNGPANSSVNVFSATPIAAGKNASLLDSFSTGNLLDSD